MLGSADWKRQNKNCSVRHQRKLLSRVLGNTLADSIQSQSNYFVANHQPACDSNSTWKGKTTKQTAHWWSLTPGGKEQHILIYTTCIILYKIYILQNTCTEVKWIRFYYQWIIKSSWFLLNYKLCVIFLFVFFNKEAVMDLPSTWLGIPIQLLLNTIIYSANHMAATPWI